MNIQTGVGEYSVINIKRNLGSGDDIVPAQVTPAYYEVTECTVTLHETNGVLYGCRVVNHSAGTVKKGDMNLLIVICDANDFVIDVMGNTVNESLASGAGKVCENMVQSKAGYEASAVNRAYFLAYRNYAKNE